MCGQRACPVRTRPAPGRPDLPPDGWVSWRTAARAGRGVRLTSQAEMLIAHTEAVLEQLARAEAEVALASAAAAVMGCLLYEPAALWG